MAALATMLVRYRRFRHILIFERRAWPDRLVFALGLGIPLTAGVAARLLLNYNAADLTLEGVVPRRPDRRPVRRRDGRRAWSACRRSFDGEFIALPFAVGCGFAGGGLRELCPKEAIWHFSPFVFTEPAAPRLADAADAAGRLAGRPAARADRPRAAAPGARRALERITACSSCTRRRSDRSWMMVVVLLATVLSVATPIKIWNNARIEHRLQEQEKLLLAAKIEALANQINPHFLFNTLTSISSLIRTQPETARMLITKLSGLLRRLMRSTDHFVTLREELESIDEYLDIEVVRFGPQLQVDKQISPDTLDVIVPSMLLQPLVENSIKHGLARKVGGGRITITDARPRRPRDHRSPRRRAGDDARSGWSTRSAAASA